MAEPTYPIGRWERENPRQKRSYTFICPVCERKSYFLGKGEKKIGRYCTWCGAENKDEECPVPKTNADRIRAMTDEELVDLLINTEEHLFTDEIRSRAEWLD